jgi:hypothetical protein
LKSCVKEKKMTVEYARVLTSIDILFKVYRKVFRHSFKDLDRDIRFKTSIEELMCR